MPPERHLLDDQADEPGTAMADRLRDRDVLHLAAHARAASDEPPGPIGRTSPAAYRQDTAPPRSPRTDGELLRVIAHAALSHIDQLVAEGLHRGGAEQIAHHALALTSMTATPVGHPDHQRRHGLGLRELLTVPTGPASTTLRHWLEDALDRAP